MIGSFLGVLLMALIGNALNLFAISPNWQSLITGGVLLFAVTLDAAGRRFGMGRVSLRLKRGRMPWKKIE